MATFNVGDTVQVTVKVNPVTWVEKEKVIESFECTDEKQCTVSFNNMHSKVYFTDNTQANITKIK